MHALSAFLLAAALLFPAVRAQAPDAPSDPRSDEAARALQPSLDAPGLLAATAALYHEATGRFPATPFELLGSATADETGLRRVLFSSLTLAPDGSGLAITFGLTPPAADPTERGGRMTVVPTDTSGRYDAPFTLDHTDDLDFSGRVLPIAHTDGYRVDRAGGTLCVDTGRVRALLAAGPLGGAAPFVGSARGLSVRFATLPARRPAGVARLVPTR